MVFLDDRYENFCVYMKEWLYDNYQIVDEVDFMLAYPELRDKFDNNFILCLYECVLL